MPKALESGLEAQKAEQSLGIVKFVSWGFLSLLLVLGLFLSIFLSNFSRKTLLTKQQEFALLLAENLNHQIYQRFLLPTLIGWGKVELKDPIQYERMENVIQSTVHSFHIDEVRIFDTDGIVSFSTDKDQLGQEGLAGHPVHIALSEGQPSFEIISRVNEFFPFSLFNLSRHTVAMRTTYPLRTERSLSMTGPIVGIIEFTQDISEDYQNILNLQRIIIISALAFCLLLFMILRMLIGRAEKINLTRILEREELERELLENERLAGMGRVVAGIAHEIRNPLGVIRSSAEILLKNYSKNEDKVAFRLLMAIFDESKRLSKTVGDFLDYARPKTPKVAFVDLAIILNQALTFLEPRVQEAGIEVKRHFAEDLVTMGDKDLIYRAIYNVFSNAIEALTDMDEVTLLPDPDDAEGLTAKNRAKFLDVEAGKTGDGNIWISIIDSGPGFSKEVVGKVMDPFFTTKDHGTGLGLAIVSNIMESHGGRVELSNAQEGGAKVTLTFSKPVLPEKDIASKEL